MKIIKKRIVMTYVSDEGFEMPAYALTEALNDLEVGYSILFDDITIEKYLLAKGVISRNTRGSYRLVDENKRAELLKQLQELSFSQITKMK